MRERTERFDVDVVGAAGQEGIARRHLVVVGAEFVENGESVRFRSAVLPQDRHHRGASKGAHNGAVRPRIGTTLSAIGFAASSSAARVIASV
jgi:hypothetical protein